VDRTCRAAVPDLPWSADGNTWIPAPRYRTGIPSQEGRRREPDDRLFKRFAARTRQERRELEAEIQLLRNVCDERLADIEAKEREIESLSAAIASGEHDA